MWELLNVTSVNEDYKRDCGANEENGQREKSNCYELVKMEILKWSSSQGRNFIHTTDKIFVNSSGRMQIVHVHTPSSTLIYLSLIWAQGSS